jgi:hypothetical protein
MRALHPHVARGYQSSAFSQSQPDCSIPPAPGLTAAVHTPVFVDVTHAG